MFALGENNAGGTSNVKLWEICWEDNASADTNKTATAITHMDLPKTEGQDLEYHCKENLS